MRHIKNKRVIEPKLIDITCDICGKSCRDEMDMNYEMISLQGSWGYSSRRDGTTWLCDMCEGCAEKVEQFIKSIGGKIIKTGYIKID